MTTPRTPDRGPLDPHNPLRACASAVDNSASERVIPLSPTAQDEPAGGAVIPSADNAHVDGHAPRHPDFEGGNTFALRHGAYSPRMIEELADEIHDALLEVAPWLDQVHFLPSVSRYLQASAREQLAHQAIMSSEKISPRLLETATAAARLAWMMAHELGMTPAGHARLKTLVADGEMAEAALVRLAEQGRSIREQLGQP